jgi:hypothetical protein
LNYEKLFKDTPLKKKPFELPKNSNLNIVDVLKEIQGNQSLQIDTAELSHSTFKGSVYTLPGNSMPVFKPNDQGSAIMPGTIQHNLVFTPKTGCIPNGLQQRELVFKQSPPL